MECYLCHCSFCVSLATNTLTAPLLKIVSCIKGDCDHKKSYKTISKRKICLACYNSYCNKEKVETKEKYICKTNNRENIVAFTTKGYESLYLQEPIGKIYFFLSDEEKDPVINCLCVKEQILTSQSVCSNCFWNSPLPYLMKYKEEILKRSYFLFGPLRIEKDKLEVDLTKYIKTTNEDFIKEFKEYIKPISLYHLVTDISKLDLFLKYDLVLFDPLNVVDYRYMLETYDAEIIEKVTNHFKLDTENPLWKQASKELENIDKVKTDFFS